MSRPSTRTAPAPRSAPHVRPAALRRRLFRLVDRAADLDDVRADVEANHDNNRWWPITIADPRMRMLAAGWSTRVSYNMISTYARVIADADARSFDTLTGMADDELTGLVTPLGLPEARITYLRSLDEFLNGYTAAGVDPQAMPANAFIAAFAAKVRQASYKVAQCAALYARGYHCGIIPVDSGMVAHLAPVLGLPLPSGPIAHEHMRRVLQDAVAARAADYRDLIAAKQHAVTLPDGVAPTWWVHLVLIYFKRRYLNRPHPDVCQRRPVCTTVIGCGHQARRP
ncbi:hypothetical protein ACQEVZ_55105 [Dactylosporangium sp. CA-152071]|uniref:hypothetical protein n=1 Tax=Dactylosporangium sp. CA-152071 TaxID=3239933 RepID=UPI003D910D6F